MSVAVLVAVRGSREGVIATAIGADSRLSLTRRCADLTEALAVAQAGGADVALLSEHPHLDRDVVGRFASAGVAVVGVAASPDGADHLHALGIVHVLPAVADAAQTVAVILEAAASAPSPVVGGMPQDSPLADSAASSTPVDARFIAVWGPTGAPGRTTIAVNLAAELARSRSVLLVDVDTYGGAVAQALGLLDEAPGIAALARAALHGSLSDDTLARHALTVGPGLRVLTGVTRADRWSELPAAALDEVWTLVRRNADVVVVDVGFCLEADEVLQYDTQAPQRNAAALSALAAADAVVAVGSAEPLGMQRLVHGLTALDHVATPANAARCVVVNKVRSAVAGPRPREAVADALRRYSGVGEVWTVPYDPRACDAATLAGQTLIERAPRSVARKSIAALAEGVMAAAPAGTAEVEVREDAPARVAAQ